MANFPMNPLKVPVTWDLNLVTVVSHNQSKIGFRGDGEVLLEGNLKDAALAFVKYVVDRECTDGTVRVEINKCVSIDCANNFELSYVGEKEEPEFWNDFVQEYNRIIRMRAFW